MLLDPVADEQLRPQAWLCRFDDGSRFAYTHYHDFIRLSDHVLWAQLSDGWLISVRCGRRLAYQVGSVFYDAVTHEPLYFSQPSQ
jgi:hypothetical protein